MSGRDKKAPLEVDADWMRSFRRRLLAWYQRHARDLPWRRAGDPYRVWVSEVMLQQTQVDAVKPYFARFVEAFPTAEALAAAPEQDVLRLWEGLGYYRRARSLHAAAKVVADEHGGRLPDDVATLLTLPGVGRYTAGAIVSIAHDKPAPILEANTIRLLTRLFAYPGDPTKAAGQRALWGYADRLVPEKQPGRFNQALMELGSLICTPKSPDCARCPVVKNCHGHSTGAIESLAPTTKKLKFTDRHEAAVVVRKQHRLLIRQCGEGERWAGLWDFPRFEMQSESPKSRSDEIAQRVRDQTGVDCRVEKRFARIKHGVTRFRITLDCYEAQHTGGRLSTRQTPARWVSPEELSGLPLSVTGRKIAKRLQSS